MGAMHPSVMTGRPAPAREATPTTTRPTVAAPSARDRRSRLLTRIALTTVLAVYLLALVQASQFLPVEDGELPLEGVLWSGIAAASCVMAAILLFARAFQVSIIARAAIDR